MSCYANYIVQNIRYLVFDNTAELKLVKIVINNDRLIFCRGFVILPNFLMTGLTLKEDPVDRVKSSMGRFQLIDSQQTLFVLC